MGKMIVAKGRKYAQLLRHVNGLGRKGDVLSTSYTSTIESWAKAGIAKEVKGPEVSKAMKGAEAEGDVEPKASTTKRQR